MSDQTLRAPWDNGELDDFEDREAERATAEQAAQVEPIRYPTVRWQCPFCRKTRAHESDARAHTGRCWANPAARGCKTCIHFDQWVPDYDTGINGGEACGLDIELPERGLPLHCADWEAKTDV